MKKLNAKQGKLMSMIVFITWILFIYTVDVILKSDKWVFLLVLSSLSGIVIERIVEKDQRKAISTLYFVTVPIMSFFLFLMLYSSIKWVATGSLLITLACILINYFVENDSEVIKGKTESGFLLALVFLGMICGYVVSDKVDKALVGPWIDTITVYEGNYPTLRETTEAKNTRFQQVYDELMDTKKEVDPTNIILKGEDGKDKTINLTNLKEQRIHFYWTNDKLEKYPIFLVPTNDYGGKSKETTYYGFIKHKDGKVYQFSNETAATLKEEFWWEE